MHVGSILASSRTNLPIYQFKALFDPHGTLVDAIQTSVHASQCFLGVGCACFQILHIGDEDVQLLVDPPEIDVVGLLGHGTLPFIAQRIAELG